MRLALAAALVLAACAGDDAALPADAGTADAFPILPDEREACADSNPLRNPYFGDLHVHTAYSFDAVTFGTRNRPEDAYRFARGEALGLPPYDEQGNPGRTLQLARPLDFVAVTDHAEAFGETQLCTDPASPAYATQTCLDYRESDIVNLDLSGIWGLIVAPSPVRPDFCAEADCAGVARTIWEREQAAAEAAYDRTSACSFTSFVAYEWSATPVGANQHRNVIFRNRQAPPVPVSYVEATWPEEMWRQLDQVCADAGTGCEALTIPHNSNLSAGTMFVPMSESFEPLTAEQAAKRARMEPLVEIYQHKGSSECLARLDEPLGAPDEACGFENIQQQLCSGGAGDPPECTPRCRDMGGIGFQGDCADTPDFARGSLAAGLAEYARTGVNPFQWGFIGSTDTHLATPGAVDEQAYPGHLGRSEDTLEDRLDDLQRFFSPGGLAVLWAEENTRDALFAAMQRREAYATSGPRLVVRFFGGWSYADDLCGAATLVEAGYQGGVPMGGVLPAAPGGGGAPRFVVSALRDAAGAPLERVQIVKGWLEGGAVQTQVYEVAGGPTGASVDLLTCTPTGAGADSLCATWEDPDFDPQSPAFYYVRVLENPTCRWSTWQCLAAQVDCATLPATDPLIECCDATLPRTIQERAWTSPIWYQP